MLGFPIAGSVAMLERGARLGHVANLQSVYLNLLRGDIYYNPKLLNQSLERLGLPLLDSEL